MVGQIKEHEDKFIHIPKELCKAVLIVLALLVWFLCWAYLSDSTISLTIPLGIISRFILFGSMLAITFSLMIYFFFLSLC